jgi:hypothetical protein
MLIDKGSEKWGDIEKRKRRYYKRLKDLFLKFIFTWNSSFTGVFFQYYEDDAPLSP